MSVPSIETENTSSTIIDDDMSIVVHDSSDTTVATQTSTSWHSIVSDIPINNNLFLRSHSINTWLKICLIEPDIRLTTAQEWRLRACMRRFISLCNLPLKISCVKIKESISLTDQEQQSLSMTAPVLISHPWRHQSQIVYDQLQQLGLYLHILSIADPTNGLLEVKLFEFYSEKSQQKLILRIPLIKPPRFVFRIALNILQLNIRSTNSLLELRFSSRENELVQGYYYQWNECKNEHIKFNITADVDQSLIDEFNTT